MPPSLPLVFVLSYPPSSINPHIFNARPSQQLAESFLETEEAARPTCLHLTPSASPRPSNTLAMKYILQAIHSLNIEHRKKLDLDDINGAIKCRFHQSRVRCDPTQQFYAYQSMQDPPTLLVGVRTAFSVTYPQVVTILRP